MRLAPLELKHWSVNGPTTASATTSTSTGLIFSQDRSPVFVPTPSITPWTWVFIEDGPEELSQKKAHSEPLLRALRLLLSHSYHQYTF